MIGVQFTFVLLRKWPTKKERNVKVLHCLVCLLHNPVDDQACKHVLQYHEQELIVYVECVIVNVQEHTFSV